METPGSEAFGEADQTLSSKAQLPPKKRPSDRGKSVDDESPENENLQINSNSSDSSNITLSAVQQPKNLDSQNPPKACIDQEPQNVGINEEGEGESSKSPSPPPVTLPSAPSQLPIACIDQETQKVGLNEESQGESSKRPSPPAVRLPFATSQRPISCKFCDQTFATTQALGGHQNAHKKERELQKAMEAANERRLNSLPGMLSHPLRGSLLGRRFPYHPYNGYSQRSGFQARALYSHPNIGYAQGPTSVRQTLPDFMGGTSIRPADASFHGWTARYAPTIGPIGRSNVPTYFNPVAGSSSTSFLQPIVNQANLAEQRMESSGLGLSLKSNEFGKMDLPPRFDNHLKPALPMMQNESTKLDLDLKL